MGSLGVVESETAGNTTVITITNDNVEVRLLTYNLFIRPPPIRTNQDDRKSERLSDFIRSHIANYDIIALQEVFGFLSGRKRHLIAEAAKRGLFYHADLPTTWKKRVRGKLVDSGLLLLSRFPILATDAVIFSQATNADGWAAKGALYALIQIGMSKLHVVTTHLQASYDSTSAGEQAHQMRARTQQVRELRDLIHKHLYSNTHEHVPLLLMGDLNVNGRQDFANGNHSEEYLRMVRDLELAEIVDLLAECNNGQHPITVGDVVHAGVVSSSEMQALLTSSQQQQQHPHPNHHRYLRHQFSGRTAVIHEGVRYLSREVALTHPKEQCNPKSLDYIFYIPPQSRKQQQQQQQQEQALLDTVSQSNCTNPLALQEQLRVHDHATTTLTSSPVGVSVGAASPIPSEFEHCPTILVPKQNAACVEPFFVPAEDLPRLPYTQLSDHYGVSARLNFERTRSL